jgi:CubicO group peptidase (beta-lactamase class C family)
MASFDALHDYLRNAAATGEVAGVAAVAGDANGTLFEAAYGVRGAGGTAAFTPDTVMWIASMTKAVTSVAAMQLVEQGRLALDTPISAVLPDLADRPVLEGFDASGAAMLRPAKRAITLRHLLTHTAGFGYDIWSPALTQYEALHDIPGIISCQNKALTTPLLFDPGERWNYGINIDFIGKAVEAVSGMTLEAYFAAHITGPLGMTDTAFRMGESQRARLSAMHARQADGALVEIPFEVPQEPEFHMGGGGLYGALGCGRGEIQGVVDTRQRSP